MQGLFPMTSLDDTLGGYLWRRKTNGFLPLGGSAESLDYVAARTNYVVILMQIYSVCG